MPLADGLTQVPPSSPEWQPKTLAAVIAQQKTEVVWFSSRQLEDWINPILTGVQLLSDAGLCTLNFLSPVSLRISFGNVLPPRGVKLDGDHLATTTKRPPPLANRRT